MNYTKGIRCRECRRQYSISPIHVCEICFGPLEAIYDSERIKDHIRFRKIEERPNLWGCQEWKFMFESLLH